VKRTGRGEPIAAVIHICMGTTRGNLLCSHLYLKPATCHASHFIFYLFSSTKSENRFCPRSGWVGTGRSGEVEGKGLEDEYGATCAHVCKCKNDTC
jgi:hypothetical protein